VELVKGAYHRWHIKHVIPLVFVTLYMLLGAVVFLWLEASAERERVQQRCFPRFLKIFAFF
jgi:hypothetical protein